MSELCLDMVFEARPIGSHLREEAGSIWLIFVMEKENSFKVPVWKALILQRLPFVCINNRFYIT